MPKVHIELDYGSVFFPTEPSGAFAKAPTMEISEELMAEYKRAAAAYMAVHDKFEQLYRVQEELKPWASPPIPEHKLL